jgi:hypothetical protein
MGQLGHYAVGLGQQCWASGWKAGPVLSGDFSDFQFLFIILENSYKVQKCTENTMLLRKILNEFLYNP